MDQIWTLITITISVLSLLLSFMFSSRNSKRQDTSEIERKARESATWDVKLGEIGSDVKDIKYDITAVKKDVQGLTERIVVVEQSAKQAHRRLDQVTGQERSNKNEQRKV